MAGPLLAIVGNIDSQRVFDPVLKDPQKASAAAEELGEELARRGARLLVYGGAFVEADVVRGFVRGKPAADKSIVMWYSQGREPPPFVEETTNPKLFDRRCEKGADWEAAFYRALTRADAVILIGGGNATLISGQVAVGVRMPILALPEFGGGAAKVWATLSAGEDLPSREDISLMATPWNTGMAAALVESLFEQRARCQQAQGAPRALLTACAGVLFLLALSVVPWIWGSNRLEVWMLFLAPLAAGGAGAAIRPAVDRARGTPDGVQATLAQIVVGLVAGGIAGVLFVTAQLTADPQITSEVANIVPYARRSIPFALGVGFVAGLTADTVFGKLIGLDVTHTSAVVAVGMQRK